MENNIDKKKLFEVINKVGKNKKLTEAVERKDIDGILGALDPAQAGELKKIMSDKAALSKLLSSEQAQSIMRSLGKDGK